MSLPAVSVDSGAGTSSTKAKKRISANSTTPPSHKPKRHPPVSPASSPISWSELTEVALTAKCLCLCPDRSRVISAEANILDKLTGLETCLTLLKRQKTAGFLCSSLAEFVESFLTEAEDPPEESLVNVSLCSEDPFISYAASRAALSLFRFKKSYAITGFHRILRYLTNRSIEQPTDGGVLNCLQLLREACCVKESKEDESACPPESCEMCLVESDEDSDESEFSFGESEDEDGEPASKRICWDASNVKLTCLEILARFWPRVVSCAKARGLATSSAFMSLWTTLVAIHSNVPEKWARAFVAPLAGFLPDLAASRDVISWRHGLDVYNEALCYGSTIALQEDVPDEALALSRVVLRSIGTLLVSVPLNEDFAGLVPSSSTEEPSVLVSKTVLLLLKAAAIRTKAGDSVSAEELGGMDSWVKTRLHFHPETEPADWIVRVLSSQDDVLVESLVCLLDIYTANPSPALCPHGSFKALLETLGYDSAVLLDYLVSDDTYFLLYLLRYMKLVAKSTDVFVNRMGSDFGKVVEVLRTLRKSLASLTRQKLFPYNDIRRFFKPLSSPKRGDVPGEPDDDNKLARKRKRSKEPGELPRRRNRLQLLESSDEDEEPVQVATKKSREEKKKETKTVPIPKKEINPQEFFGASKKPVAEENVHEDEAFKETLRKLENSSVSAGKISAEVSAEKSKTEKSKHREASTEKSKKHRGKSNDKNGGDIDKGKSNDKKEKSGEKHGETSDEKKKKRRETSDKSKEKMPGKSDEKKKETPKADSPKPVSKEKTPTRTEESRSAAIRTPSTGTKAQPDDDFTDANSEKRKSNYLNYQKYLQRSGPRNPGTKTVPEGTENCFQGLSFVITGVMESLTREEMEEIVKKHNGKVVHSVSRNTSYVVVGEEPGPSKMKKAETCKTKLLTEDEFLDLIVTCSESVPKSPPPKSEGTKKSKKRKRAEDDVIPATPKMSKKSENVINEAKDSSRNEKSSSSSGSRKLEQISPTEKEIVSRDAKKPIVISKIAPEPLPPKKVFEDDGSPPCQLWVDKYRPTEARLIIGQHGDRSCANKLRRWLQDWHKNFGDPNKKVKAAPPWFKDEWGASFKAALLSGSPGVGKTTTATVIAKELGFDLVELNASDTRNKKSLEAEVSEMVSCKALGKDAQKSSSKRVVIMDEVDGMAGNQDRGGVAELIKLVKVSRVPIICICNDRNHQKIRSLANYCFDLRFSKPRTEQIKAAMMTVCFKEGIKVQFHQLIGRQIPP
ncbi:unnamed protein product, partial [Notodromas monacha]